MYAIIDVETTGGSPVSEKLTEIAVFLHDGERIVDEFTTLINPEKKIPYHITSLTGITNAMVADAPKFYEVARKVVELTENSIFVAHNVSFDYEFIRNEFKRLGFNYTREKLCTVQLSRRLIPGLPSYSLGRICNYLDIQIQGRHRAAGDAYATVKLFEHLLELSRSGKEQYPDLSGIDKKLLHPNLDPESIHSLPDEAGTYYFFNDKEELIYIGKSKNIHSRVLSHFRNFSSRKSIEMLNNIAGVDYELTGSELIALLKESHEIKKERPVYNRAQRRSVSMYGLYHYLDNQGYQRLIIEKNDRRQDIPLITFSGLKAGKRYLNEVIGEFELCQKLGGVYPAGGSCFSYEIGSCRGACIGKEAPVSYNQRVDKLIARFQFKHSSFYILEEGRTPEELAVVKIDCGKYIGYGYTDSNLAGNSIGQLNACISSYEDNRDVQQIIRSYLHTHHSLKMIPFSSCDEHDVIHN